MIGQHAATWIFVGALCAGIAAVATFVVLAPVGTRQIRLLLGLGVATGTLAIIYIALASLLPRATTAVPHSGVWAPEVVQSIAPTLGVVTVGSVSVWAALLTAERTRLSTFDWSEAEIFGNTLTAIAAIDEAMDPFYRFLSTIAAPAGWDMLTAAWRWPGGKPRVLGAHVPQASKAIESAFIAEQRNVLARALRTAEAAMSHLAAAEARIGRPLRLAHTDAGKSVTLDSDVGLLRDLLAWADHADEPEVGPGQSRLVFLLARAANAGRPGATPVAGQEAQRARPAPWLPELLGRLEPFRPPGSLPPFVPDGEVEDLRLVTDAWHGMEQAHLARAKLFTRLDAANPARNPSRPFSASTHTQLWSRVIDEWRSDMAGQSSAAQPEVPRSAALITYEAQLPVADIIVTLTVPAPADSDLVRQAVAAGVSGPLLAGRLNVLHNSVSRYLSKPGTYPDMVWPFEVHLWAVDHEAQWHTIPMVADVLDEAEIGMEYGSPLKRSLEAAERDKPQETLWLSPLPLMEIRWWVASYQNGESNRFRPREGEEARRELRVADGEVR